MSMLPTTVNFLVLLGATVCAWLFGAMYYGSLGKQWVAAQGSTPEDFRPRQAASRIAGKSPFFLSFLAELIMAYVLLGLMKHVAHTGPLTVSVGLITGAFVWFGFMLTAIAVNYAHSGRKITLIVIDAFHWLGVVLILGGMIGALAN